MIRTQVQLPDDLYRRAKRLAEAKEISLAELARRGFEVILGQYPDPDVISPRWELPIVRGLGWSGLDHSQIKATAQQSALEQELQEKVNSEIEVRAEDRVGD